MLTTTRCSDDEKTLIETTAKSKGYSVSKFIYKSLAKNLPVRSVPIFDRNIERKQNRLSFEIPSDVKNQIDICQALLSSKFKPVYKWEIILFCALKECNS